jgi:hypothetical protein
MSIIVSIIVIAKNGVTSYAQPNKHNKANYALNNECEYLDKAANYEY